MCLSPQIEHVAATAAAKTLERPLTPIRRERVIAPGHTTMTIIERTRTTQLITASPQRDESQRLQHELDRNLRLHHTKVNSWH